MPMTLSLLLLACGASHRTDTDSAPTATEPGVATVLFDQALFPALLDAIEAATTRVDVSQYTIYDSGSVSQLIDALIDAAGRGVAVRVVADEEAGDTQDSLDRLTAGGVDARLDSPDQTSHNKLVLVDEAAFVGSHNWSSHALEKNHEGSVHVGDPAVAAFYTAVYESLWQDSSDPIDVAWTGQGPVTPLVNRQVAPALLDCLGAAQTRIRLGLYALAHDDRYPDSNPALLVGALTDAQARGVDVQVILDASDWIVDNGINDDAIALLEAGGVTVHRSPAATTNHAKVLVCDGVVIVSDANWSYSSLDLYNGTSARIDDPAAAAATVAWWQGLLVDGR